MNGGIELTPRGDGLYALLEPGERAGLGPSTTVLASGAVVVGVALVFLVVAPWLPELAFYVGGGGILLAATGPLAKASMGGGRQRPFAVEIVGQHLKVVQPDQPVLHFDVAEVCIEVIDHGRWGSDLKIQADNRGVVLQTVAPAHEVRKIARFVDARQR